MNLHRSLMFLVLFILPVTVVQAADFEIETSIVHGSVIEGENAMFDVRITNNQDFEDVFRLSTNDLFWSLTSDPLHHYFSGVVIKAGEAKTVRLILTPDKAAEFGHYKIDVNVEAEKNRIKERFTVLVGFSTSKPLISDYFAAVNRFVEVPHVINPKEDVTVRVNLANRNPKKIDELTVRFSSKLMSREVKTSLYPLEKKFIEETFRLDPLTEPQKDVLTVEIIFEGESLAPTIKESFEVGSYPEISEEFERTSKSFLRSVTENAYRNTGNVKASKTVQFPTNLFKSYFTKSNLEKFEMKKDGKRYAAWEISLEPDETITITRSTDYRSLLMALLLAVAAFVLYYLFRSPVVVTKRANVMHVQDTGISEIKLFLHIRNRTDRTYERFTITDTIPSPATASGGTDVGTLKPDSIYDDGSKTVVKWKIKKIRSKEDCILSYSMKSKVAIIDSITLPPAVVKFHNGKGTKRITRSGPVKAKI